MSKTTQPVAGVVAQTPIRHQLAEDLTAMIVGTMLISLGLGLYKDAGLLSGGIAGVSFLLHYAAHVPFSSAFFVLNAPFYLLALRQLGVAFTARTFCAVTILSLMTSLWPRFISVSWVHPAYASIVGGIALGIGTLVLFRHRTSLGGVGIAVLYLQDRFGWRAGKIQMAVDSSIVLSAFFFVEPSRIAWSVLSAVVLNLILAMNHRAGRYIGF